MHCIFGLPRKEYDVCRGNRKKLQKTAESWVEALGSQDVSVCHSNIPFVCVDALAPVSWLRP